MTLNNYTASSGVQWPLSSSRNDIIRLQISMADNSDIDFQPWRGIAVAYHSPRQTVSLLYGDQGIWRFVVEGAETRLSATAHLKLRHKTRSLLSWSMTATQILKTDCACPYNQPLNYIIDIDDRAPLRKELANTSILSISLSDQKVLCSVETPGKQLPELLGEVFGTFSLVPSAMLIASVVGAFLFWCCSKRCFGTCRPRCCSKSVLLADCLQQNSRRGPEVA